MLFRQLFDQTSCTFTYLLADEESRQALMIDPVIEHVALYQQLINELSLKLVYSLETHTHADHITASGQLRQKFNCQIVTGLESPAEGIDQRLQDGEILSLASLQLRALHTPGHTHDSVCYALTDRVFTGDTLLIRGTGRTDFQGGSAEQQYHSLMTKVLSLADDTLVYPGHDYKVMTSSTIGEEKSFNPRLQAKSVADYVQIMADLNLAKPKLMDIAVPANLKCGLTT